MWSTWSFSVMSVNDGVDHKGTSVWFVEVEWSVSNNQHSTCSSYRNHMYRKVISLILGPHESHVMLTCFCYSFVWRSVWSLVFYYIKSILIKVIQIFCTPAHISYLSFCSSVEETNNYSAEGLLKEEFTQKWKWAIKYSSSCWWKVVWRPKNSWRFTAKKAWQHSPKLK